MGAFPIDSIDFIALILTNWIEIPMILSWAARCRSQQS